jgi:dsDNA-binding SOS-regulon protein
LGISEADYRQLVQQSSVSSSGKGQSKYRNVKTVVDGITFDSKKEAQRYHELKLMEKAGKIRYLRTQVAFHLTAGRENTSVGMYIADFCYEESHLGEHWNPVVEDCKGMRTALYKWKAKHMKAEHGITIRET